jgi:hypothetical protein
MKFVNESVEDVLKPKTEDEIYSNLEDVFDEIAMILLGYDEFTDYLKAYEFVESNRGKVEEYLKDGENTPEEIANYLLYGPVDYGNVYDEDEE